MNGKKVLSLVAGSLLALGLALFWSRARAPFPLPVQKPAPPAQTLILPRLDATEELPRGGPGAVHAAAAALSPAGTVWSLWYRGTREGSRDTVLEASCQKPGDTVWHSPTTWVSAPRLARALGTRIKTVGNAVFSLNREHEAQLWISAVSYGGWSGSRIYTLCLDPFTGKWLGRPRPLNLSNTLNISHLVRSSPQASVQGTVLALYRETAHTLPLWVLLGNRGTTPVAAVWTAPQSRGLLQPTLSACPDGSWISLLRSARPNQPRIFVSFCPPKGTWSPPRPTTLPHPNAGIDALLWSGSSLLVAYNPDASHRRRLALALLGTADGQLLTGPLLVDHSVNPNGEASYPTLLQGMGEAAHLFWTRDRKSIRHCRLSRMDAR